MVAYACTGARRQLPEMSALAVAGASSSTGRRDLPRPGYVLTAAQGYQAALEFAALGHGLLTHGSVSLELTADDLRDIESAASRIPVQGARYPESQERLTYL